MKPTRIASVAAIVLLLPVAGAVVAAAAFGGPLLAAAIERAGPATVGREVRVGDVAIDWGRFTTVTADDLVVADAAWSADSPLLRVRRTELTIDLLDAFRLRFSPVRLVLRHPNLDLARNAQGRWNLPDAGTGGGGSGGPASAGFAALREVEVENGEATLDDLATPGVEGRIAAFSARTPRAEGGIGFDGTARWGDGAPIAFSGRSGSVVDLLRTSDDGAKPFPIRLAIGPETARVHATGHIARPLDLAGFDLRIQGQGDDLAPLLAALAVAPAAATPPFELAAHLTDTERGWDMDDVAARLGESQARGKASISFGRQRRPRLSVHLVAQRAVLSDFDWLASGGGQSGASPVADAPLPTAWLRLADAEGDLRVERLEGMRAGAADLRAGFKLDRGELRVQPLRLGLAGGVAEGTATINAGEDAPPRIALKAEARGMRLGPLFAGFGIDQIKGKLTAASVDLRGRGATLRQVAAALDGAARFRVDDGSLDLPDLAHLSMGLGETLAYAFGGSAGATPTPVACALGDFPVRKGTVHAERLSVLTPRLLLVGEGTIRLDEATIRLTLVPKPLDEALFRVVVPVVVSGALSSPKVTTHPELRSGARPETAAGMCGKEASRG